MFLKKIVKSDKDTGIMINETAFIKNDINSHMISL